MKTPENQKNFTKLKEMILRVPTKCAEVDRFTGTWLVTYWTDHAVREIRLVALEHADEG